MIDRLQPFVSQRLQQVNPRGFERRREPECHARDERQHDREGEHSVVERQIHGEREVDPLQRRMPHHARMQPATPPPSDSSRLSVSRCRTS